MIGLRMLSYRIYMTRVSTNLYTPPTKGYYIYKIRFKPKFTCQRRFDTGQQRSWICDTVEECLDKLRAYDAERSTPRNPET
jgi:hypothetical protein